MDLSQFHFSIIYSVDVPKGVTLTQYVPPHYRKREWTCTESGKSEYEYLEGDWEHGRHRKYCAILTFAEFCEFIDHVGLYVEKSQTLGSLGAPGLGYGLSPAVPFQSEDRNAIQSAYVTPIPPQAMGNYGHGPTGTPLPGFPDDVDMPNWESVEKEMWEWFTDGAWSARNFAEEIAV